MSREINTIANEIYDDWKDINYAAKPYLEVMTNLKGINDRFIMDDARGIVLRFLCNAGTWRGETARRIKKELKELVKNG